MLIACFLFLILVAESISELHCSKFHYEEKLLEKMIRTEVFVEDMKKEMDAIQKSVKEALAKLNEDTTNWATEIEAMHRDGDTKLTALQEKANSELEKNAKLVESLKDTISSPDVVFSARNAKDTNPSPGAIIVFTETLLNRGDSYSTDTGIFTAPYVGTYIFNVQLCVNGNKYIDFGIVVNNVFMTIAHYDDNYSSGRCHSSAATVALKSGDNVSIKVARREIGQTLYQSGSYYWNTFSGILVNAD